MRVGAAKLGRALVHPVHKGADAAGDIGGEDVARLVRRMHYRAVKQVLIRHLLTGLDVGVAGVLAHARPRVRPGGDDVLHAALAALYGLYRKKAGHDLRKAGGGALLLGILGIEYLAGVEVRQKHGLGAEIGIVQRGGGGGKRAQREAYYKNKRENFNFFHFALPFFFGMW